MAGSLAGLTPERWDTIKTILSGGDDSKVSLSAAASAAGVTQNDIKKWVIRSREKRGEDDPFIHDIAIFYDTVPELQIGKLEDTIWRRAMEGEEKIVWHKGENVGTEFVKDNKLLMRLVEVRSDKYRKINTPIMVVGDLEDTFKRLQAGVRLAQARVEEEDALALSTIDHDVSEYT